MVDKEPSHTDILMVLGEVRQQAETNHEEIGKLRAEVLALGMAAAGYRANWRLLVGLATFAVAVAGAAGAIFEGVRHLFGA